MKKNLVEKYIELYKKGYSEVFDKYLHTKTMQRLKGIGMYCGMDYVGINMLRPKNDYTRYDHSVVTCYGTYALTEDLIQALAALFHDSGTAPFSHVNSYKNGEGETQENDEEDVLTILKKDKELLEHLKNDKINLLDVCDASKYPIVDKERPALCMDRLDGILSTCLLCTGKLDFEYISELINMVVVFEQKDYSWCYPMNERLESYNIEIGLNEMGSKLCYEDFFEAISIFGRMLQSKESRYAMTLLGDILKIMELEGIISGNENSETEIIKKMVNSKYKNLWLDFTKLSKVEEVDESTNGYVLTPKSKIRYTFPLVWDGTSPTDFFGISGELYDDYIKLQDQLDKIDIPLKGNLSEESEKILLKYKK